MNSKVTTKEEVWEILAETSRKIQENDDKVKESLAETSRKIQENSDSMKESSAETDRKFQETSDKIQELSVKIKEARELFEGQWGKLMESLVRGDLVKMLQERNIDVRHTFPNVDHRSKEDQYEYDIIAVNGTEAVVVEVKTTLKVKHIKKFLEDLKKFPHRFPDFKEKITYGAIAYLNAHEKSTTYAEKQGLFVIRATGSSASLINKEDFKPKRFS